MAFSVYFSTSLKGGGKVKLFKGAGDKTSNYKSGGGHPHVKGRKRERESLAGDKDAVHLGCRINNYSASVDVQRPSHTS